MEKKDQTEKVVAELYKLTKQFTKVFQPHYYYQYNGDIDDLASEFFVQFMTPKASGDRPKETLLDKFDESITSLPYLVKVSVIRKLIDQSRQHPYRVVSLDASLENGDSVLQFFNVFEESKQRTVFEDNHLIKKIKEEFVKLPEDVQNRLFVELFDTDSSLAKHLHPVIRKIRNCPIQQVTSRTIILYIPIACVYVAFDVETGKPRGPFKPFILNKDELAEIKSQPTYHSFFSKELLQEYLEGVN